MPSKSAFLQELRADLARSSKQQLLLGTLLGLLPSPLLYLLAVSTHSPLLGLGLVVPCVLGVVFLLPLATAKSWRFLGYGLMLGWVCTLLLLCLLLPLFANVCSGNCNPPPAIYY
jgi:hypothetical protein